MSTASVTTPALLTAEEFAQRPDPGYSEELVRGRIVPMPMPKPRHGEICNRVGRILGDCARTATWVACSVMTRASLPNEAPTRCEGLIFPSTVSPAFPRGLCPIATSTRRPTW